MIILTDEDIPALRELIETFKDTNLYYVFGDLAVYQILKEFNITKRGVYNPSTLITNYVDFLFWKEFKIRGLFPTLEIPLTDIDIIGKNKKLKLFYKGFGMNVMFHSKRKLLSTYKEHKNIMYDFVGSNDLSIIDLIVLISSSVIFACLSPCFISPQLSSKKYISPSNSIV